MSTVVIVEAERPAAREASARDILDLLETPAFNALLGRIDCMIESERKTCEASADIREIRKAQGAVRALRTVRNLPAMLLHDAEQPDPSKRK